VWIVVITRNHTQFCYCDYPFELGDGKKKKVVRPVVLWRWVVRTIEEAGFQVCEKLSPGERDCLRSDFSWRDSISIYRALRIPNSACC
jgi:hypothetical protein